MEFLKSISEIFDYADKHNIPFFSVIMACIIFGLAWVGKKGGGKALSVMGGVLNAADKMLESMQKRMDTLQKALERSEELNEQYREKLILLQKEIERMEEELAFCEDTCNDCQRELTRLLTKAK